MNRPLWHLTLGLACALGPARARADEPRSIDLFRAGADGYAVYRIPGLVATPAGTLLAYAEARRTSRSDWGAIDIVLRRGTDGGRTWEPMRRLAGPPDGATKNPVALAQGLGKPGEITLNNPVAIVEPDNGAIHVLYCVEYARCFHIRSLDDGRTFSDPVEITPTFDAFRPEYDWKVLATGPGHGIRLRSGRLVVPVWLSTGTGGHAHRPSAVATIVSDDRGRTWTRGAIVVGHPALTNPSETVAVELADGRVLLNIRHETTPHRRAVAIGPDGAGGWGEVRLDEALPEPICMASLIRLPDAPGPVGGGLLFANPYNFDDRTRRNLTLQFSPDDGATWPVRRTLDPGPSGYSDLAVAPDGAIYCLYERGVADDGKTRPGSLRLVRLDRDWLAGGP